MLFLVFDGGGMAQQIDTLTILVSRIVLASTLGSFQSSVSPDTEPFGNALICFVPPLEEGQC